MKRTTIDFSGHELIIEENDLVKIHHLKKPDTIAHNIKYINCGGVLSVTGDYGNWIFCREFHPSADGYVSVHYWIEKLQIASSQKGEEFDQNSTQEEIQKGIDGGLKEYGYEGKELTKMLEYYDELSHRLADGESEYTSYAYYNMPDFMDAEDVPCATEIKYWLRAVFDGFEEICRRLKDER